MRQWGVLVCGERLRTVGKMGFDLNRYAEENSSTVAGNGLGLFFSEYSECLQIGQESTALH